MVSKKELESRIANNEVQAEQAKLLAMLRHGELVSGAYKLRGLKRGCEPTDEEKADGQVIGFRDMTDEEKLQDTVDTMHRHIEWYRMFGEAAASMRKAKRVMVEGHERFEIHIPE